MSLQQCIKSTVFYIHFTDKASDSLYGMQLKKKRMIKSITINWKQGSFLGKGGDRSQTYTIFEYETAFGDVLPVYIQKGYDAALTLVCDQRFQYGISDGVVFLVLHDKQQKPYQHRFILNDLHAAAYAGNAWLIAATGGHCDLSWVVGDYLHDVHV